MHVVQHNPVPWINQKSLYPAPPHPLHHEPAPAAGCSPACLRPSRHAPAAALLQLLATPTAIPTSKLCSTLLLLALQPPVCMRCAGWRAAGIHQINTPWSMGGCRERCVCALCHRLLLLRKLLLSWQCGRTGLMVQSGGSCSVTWTEESKSSICLRSCASSAEDQ